jgi:hypothetical protein
MVTFGSIRQRGAIVCVTPTRRLNIPLISEARVGEQEELTQKSVKRTL